MDKTGSLQCGSCNIKFTCEIECKLVMPLCRILELEPADWHFHLQLTRPFFLLHGFQCFGL